MSDVKTKEQWAQEIVDTIDGDRYQRPDLEAKVQEIIEATTRETAAAVIKGLQDSIENMEANGDERLPGIQYVIKYLDDFGRGAP